MLLIRRLLIPVLLFCGILTTMAQQKGPPASVNRPSPNEIDFLKGPQIPKPNLRMKFVRVSPGATPLDTLSIIPHTFAIFGIPDSAYRVDYVNATITWKNRPAADSVYIVYRTFPYKLNGIANHFNYDSVENFFMVRPSSAFMNNGQAFDNFFNFGNINYNGSFGRGISFGNSQDAVVTSNLNLQISGYLADSIEISAAITDNNIPIQPDGTTATLNEFDRVFLQFRKKTWALSMGDIDLRENRDYYLNFYKRLQGGSFETTNKISDGISNKTLVSGAIAKGKFNTNVFQGLEGNQGPYKLQGSNNEVYFVVLAGTEKVFLDGELLQRGQDQDYTINYNTAEVTFTPKRMITSDSRIQVQFEYADRNYLNVNLYLSSETDFKDKLKLRVGWYNNSDSRNSPINQTLTDDQRRFLSQLGDSVQNAYYPIATPDTFAAGTIQYKRIDTVYAKANGSIVHVSVFVYSTNPDSAIYTLSFALVGQGNGDYIPDLNGVNGNIYIWVSPVNGVKQGQYEAAQFLVTPKTLQVLTLGADYKFDKHTTMSVDLARSHYDVNTLSSIDKGNDNGYAAKMLVKNVSNISSAEKGLQLTSIMGYEYEGQNFQPVERLHAVEYYRDWGLPLVVASDNEYLYTASFQLSDKKSNSLRYDFASLDRGNSFSGVRNTITQKQDIDGWKLNNMISLTTSGTPTDKGYYFRPTFDLSKKLSWLGNYTMGATYAVEHNESHDRSLNTIDSTSFAFTTFQAYLKSPEKNPNNWGLTYFTRENSSPYGTQLVKSDRSKNVNLFMQITKNPRHQFRFNATYRNLQIVNSTVSAQTADNSLLGRAEYQVKEWKGMLTGNLLYEVGSGQVQKLNYSYVQVPAGTGQYAWIDANGDGIQQLNEFVLAQFSDQAIFIRIFTPTDVYIKANYNTLNYSILLNPRLYFDPVKSKGFKKFLTRLSLQSSLQRSQKEQAQGFVQLNPFKAPLNDTSLITQTSVLVNTFSFNRASAKFGFDISNSNNGGKTFLTYGYETRLLKEWSLRTRWNLSKAIAFNTTYKTGSNELFSSAQNFDSSNYNLRQYSFEPDITYTRGANLRIMMGYKYSEKTNPSNLGGQKYSSNALNSEFKYNILQSTSVQAHFTYSNILYSTVNGGTPDPNSSVGYVILDGLVPGKNYLWGLDFTKKLGTNLELTIQYEGRKPGESTVVHTGRASLRALL